MIPVIIDNALHIGPLHWRTNDDIFEITDGNW